MKRLSLSLLLQLLMLFVSGQTVLDDKVSVNFDHASLNIIADELEKQADVKFYFEPRQFDSVSFTISADQVTIAQLLDRTFSNTDIKYSLYNARYIIITRGKQIVTDFRQLTKTDDLVSKVQEKDSVQLASNVSKLYVIGMCGTKRQGSRLRVLPCKSASRFEGLYPMILGTSLSRFPAESTYSKLKAWE